MKKLTSFDQLKSEEIIVDSIKHLANREPAEEIANKFSKVSQEYQKLNDGDLEIPPFDISQIPQVEVEEVKATLKEMDPNKSNVIDDIPAKFLNILRMNLLNQ